MQSVTGLAGRRQLNGHRAGGSVENAPHVPGGNAEPGHLLKSSVAALVAAHSAHEAYAMAESGGVSGKVKRRAAQPLRPLRENIPENLADADDVHRGSSRNARGHAHLFIQTVLVCPFYRAKTG